MRMDLYKDLTSKNTLGGKFTLLNLKWIDSILRQDRVFVLLEEARRSQNDEDGGLNDAVEDCSLAQSLAPLDTCRSHHHSLTSTEERPPIIHTFDHSLPSKDLQPHIIHSSTKSLHH